MGKIWHAIPILQHFGLGVCIKFWGLDLNFSLYCDFSLRCISLSETCQINLPFRKKKPISDFCLNVPNPVFWKNTLKSSLSDLLFVGIILKFWFPRSFVVTATILAFQNQTSGYWKDLCFFQFLFFSFYFSLKTQTK